MFSFFQNKEKRQAEQLLATYLRRNTSSERLRAESDSVAALLIDNVWGQRTLRLVGMSRTIKLGSLVLCLESLCSEVRLRTLEQDRADHFMATAIDVYKTIDAGRATTLTLTEAAFADEVWFQFVETEVAKGYAARLRAGLV